MSKLLIKNGRVIDPANHLDEVADILIENGKISKIAKNIANNGRTIIDASDKIVMPGLVDMHVHLREPGREDKETIATGTLAALKGGVTTLLAMPNTHPAIDSPEHIEILKSRIKNSAHAEVLICGAITRERMGKELTDFVRLKKSGAIALSDDGSSVDDAALLLKALKKAKEHHLALICHSEDKTLSGSGVVNRGFVSTRLGLRGISKESEFLRVQRDINLAEKANTPIHITHLSCKESVEMVCKAKKKGLKVTCDTAPHYFSLSEEAVVGFDPNMKMNPPLRTKEDLAAIRQGLKNGAIDAIASDHAPHTENEKDIEFDRAEFGVVGLETELAVAITELVLPGLIDWEKLVEKMSRNPAKILGIDKGILSIGAAADLIVLSPEKEWAVEKKGLVSKSKNSCFLGRKLKGLVEYTIFSGKIAYQGG